jgi:phage shock protein C
MHYEKQFTSKGLYRCRNGVFLGVCRGIAEYFDFPIFWVRLITIFMFFVSGLWPVLAIYLFAAFLMKPEPVIPLGTDEEREFYDSYTHSRGRAAQRIKQRYDRLERRLRRLEDNVTTRSFDWDERLKS